MLILLMLSLLASAKLAFYFNGQFTRVNYSLGNFGHVPYGRTMSGTLIRPRDLSELQYDLCNATIGEQTKITNSWMIVQKGNCSETTKAIVAQKFGAKLVIIVSDQDNLTSKVQMVNDGMGFKVHIPAILIGKADGIKIFNELSNIRDVHPYGIISFNDSKRVQNPPVIFFLTLHDPQSFKFLRDFKTYYEQLKQDVPFGVTYEVLVSKYDAKINFTKGNQDCLGGGRYCFDVLEQDANGRQVIEEQLRQQCLWQNNETQWFEYMEYFWKNCLAIKEYDQCYKNSKASNVEKCVEQSFIQENDKARDLWSNILMDQWVMNQSRSGMEFYPGVLVNNVPFKGNFEAEGVFEDICSSKISLIIDMINQTVCESIQLASQDQPASSNSIDWALISFAIVSCIIFGIFLFICYRRRLKKQMQQELGQQVNEMVSQYIKFYETKNEA